MATYIIDFKLIERVNEGMKAFPRVPTLDERQQYQFKESKLGFL